MRKLLIPGLTLLIILATAPFTQGPVSGVRVVAQANAVPSGLNQSQFVVIASDGLGDPTNAYSWSMEVFKGKVFIGIGKVGTITQPLIIYLLNTLNVTLSPELEHAVHGGYWPPYLTDWVNMSGGPGNWVVTNCTAYRLWREGNRAEIWFYDPEVNMWFLSYRSGLANVSELFANPHVCDTPGDELKGIWVPMFFGFRIMKAYKGCLYVGSGGISGMFRTPYYQPPLLLRTCDGFSWEVVPTPLQMGADTRAIESHSGWLYVASTESGIVGTSFVSGYALVWGSNGHPNSTSDWVIAGNLTGDEVPSVGNVRVTSLKSFNGYLYAGTGNIRYGCEVWRSTKANPTDPKNDWVKVFDYGGGDMMNYWAGTMEVFNNTLYVGTLLWPFAFSQDGGPAFRPRGFDIFEVLSNGTWNLLVGAYIPRLPVEGWPYDLYLNITINNTEVTVPVRIPRSYYPSGFGNLFNIYDWSMEVFNNTLYVGTMDWSTFLHFLSAEDLLKLFGVSEEEVNETIEEIIEELRIALDYLNQSGQVPDEYIEMLSDLIDDLEATLEEGNLTAKVDELKELFLTYFGGADLWRSGDGTLWIPVTLNGFNNYFNYGLRVLRVGPSSPVKLYVGTANPFSGTEVLRAPEKPPPQPLPPIVGGFAKLASWESPPKEAYSVGLVLAVAVLVLLLVLLRKHYK